MHPQPPKPGRPAALAPALAAFVAVVFAACAPSSAPPAAPAPVVVSHALLGSLVRDLVGDRLEVQVLMPNGLDPHEWEPSAKDIEAVHRARYLVVNGLELEAALEEVLDEAQKAGVPLFDGSQAIDRLATGEEPEGEEHEGEEHEGEEHEGEEHHHGAFDPHYWMDPLAMKAVVLALAADLKARLGVDLDDRAGDLAGRLDALAGEVRTLLAPIPAERRVLVTGHESLGYFARAYDLRIVGAIVPSLTSQAEVSAADMAALKKAIAAEGVRVIFTELGTPPKVAEVLASEAGVRTVEIGTHALPADGSYFTFFKSLATEVANGL